MKRFNFTMVGLFRLEIRAEAVNLEDAHRISEVITNDVFKSVAHHQGGKTAFVNIVREDKNQFTADAFLYFFNVRTLQAEDEEEAYTKIMRFFNDEYALVRNHLVTDKPTIVIREAPDYARVEDPGLLSI